MTSILISGGIIVTVNNQRHIIDEGSILIEDDRIVRVGKLDEFKNYPRAEKQIDAKGKLIIPGLIDTHVHLAQALIRGCADDTALIDWLRKYVWPLQGNFDAQDGKASAELCMLEMIKSGTTTFLESLLHSRYGFDGIAETVRRSGMRGILSKTVMGLPSYGEEANIMHPGMVEDGETCLREVEGYHKRWNGQAEGRIRVWYGARSLGGCTPELYRQIGEGANRLRTGVTMHLSEVQEDVRYANKEFGKMPCEFMDEVGLAGRNVVFAHGVWLTEKEWQILAEKGGSVSHCPSSNLKLASGVARVPEMLGAGVNVSLGCDGGPSNNCYDMIREMKTASLIHKARLFDPRVLNAETALEMATINGARAVSLQNEIGTIEAGKKADLVIVSFDSPHMVPPLNPLSHLIYAANGSDVLTVIIDGKIVMEDRVVITLNEDEVLRHAKERGERLLERTEIKIAPKWPLV